MVPVPVAVPEEWLRRFQLPFRFLAIPASGSSSVPGLPDKSIHNSHVKYKYRISSGSSSRRKSSGSSSSSRRISSSMVAALAVEVVAATAASG